MNFYTRKKNISFGLFKSIEPQKEKPVKLLLVSGNASEIGTHVVAPSSPKLGPRGSQTGSISSQLDMRSSAGSRHKPKNGVPADSEPILPIAHYESSKTTIKGSHFVMEPGA